MRSFQTALVLVCLWVGGWMSPNPAAAQDQTHWNDLQAALLAEAAFGDQEMALREYERLVRDLPGDHAVLPHAIYRLAETRKAMGNLEGAREALLSGIRSGSCRAPCQALLGRIQLELDAVRTLPVLWTFDDSKHGIFHPWELDEVGTVRVQTKEETENPALTWETTVDIRANDRLVVGFKTPLPAPREVSFRMQSAARAGAVRIRVTDRSGHQYIQSGASSRVDFRAPTKVVVALKDLVPVDPNQRPLNPAEIYRLYIEDVSAMNGTEPGPMWFALDDFSIR